MRGYRAWIFLLVLGIVVGLVAWSVQLRGGIIFNNLRNSFAWGLYIAMFVFLFGIAVGGLIILSSIYLFELVSLKPLAKISTLTAFASAVGAGVMIFPDLGRPKRAINMLLKPNFSSPLVWDLIVISATVLLLLLYLYVQALPNLAARKSRLAFLVKGKSDREAEVLSARILKALSIIAFPAAILILAADAWIFATQMSRPWWHSAVMAPDFIAVAIASDAVSVILVSLIVSRGRSLKRDSAAFSTLVKIAAAAIPIHFFFMYNDFLLRWWWNAPHELEPLVITLRHYTRLHLAELILPLAAFAMLLYPRLKASYRGLTSACLILLIGVFAHRYLLLPSAYNYIPLSLTVPGGHGAPGKLWPYPTSLGAYNPPSDTFVTFWNYLPSITELLVAVLPLALVLLIITLGRRFYLINKT